MIYRDPTATDVEAVNNRVAELVALNRQQQAERTRVRQIMNNRQALIALVGDTIKDPSIRLPIANLMLKANETLARKIGRRPDTKVDPPVSDDSDRARKRAEKRARIVECYDDVCTMKLMLPQVGRWLPGYGFTAAVVRQGYSKNKDPYPVIELRDPYTSFPGEWGASQHPCDVAFAYRISRSKLAGMYPQHKDQILTGRRAPGGGVLLDRGGAIGRVGQASWGSQSGGGVDVYEYYDERGCWWVLPESNLMLDYVPNLLSSPQFRIVKRFAFDELVGAYDHAIGVMANMARLALLSVIAVEDSVMAETNVIGDMRGDVYRRGRNSVNFFSPGTSVAKMNSHVPFEAFQQMDRMERQLRTIAGHSSQEDGESSLSFATGEGLRELQTSTGLEVREYLSAIEYWLCELDSLRLEHDEVTYADTEKLMYGVRSGAPFAEKYTPAGDIKGDYRTRRVYGAMAGFDDATKIITGLQLMSAEVIDRVTLREQIDGLENHSKIAERIEAERATKIVEEGLAAMAQQGAPEAIKALLTRIPDSEWKTQLEEIFVTQAEANQQQAAVAPPAMPGPAPDVQTVLSRLSADGNIDAGSQIVSRVA